MHSEWLNKSRDSLNEVDLIINQYKVAMNAMKDLLVQSMIHYNVTIMSAAIILMGHVMYRFILFKFFPIEFHS